MTTCGTCTLCCRLVPVAEIGLPSFTPCPHLRPIFAAAGPGCGIYPHRPHSCRGWSCLYLHNGNWGDDLRPDRCGVVFDEIPDLITIPGLGETPCVQAWVAPGHEAAWQEQPVLAVVLAMLDRGAAVLFRLAPNRAFGVWRNAKGEVCSSSPNASKKTSGEDDRRRLQRARQRMENL